MTSGILAESAQTKLNMNILIIVALFISVESAANPATTANSDADIPERCTAQRQKMFECLTMLIETTEEQEMATARKALTEDSGIQSIFLSQWERGTKSLDKCRKLDSKFDKCLPSVISSSSNENKTNYLLDKLDCSRNASRNMQILDMKDGFFRQVEDNCFNKTTHRAKDEPCEPNEEVKKCLAEESLATTQDWLISQDKSSVKLGELLEESKKEKVDRWRCYECVYITSEECRPTDQQHDCISSQKRPIHDLHEKLVKECMVSRGYGNVSVKIPEVEMYVKGRMAPKGDFCSWIKDDITIY